jgi:starch synthase (maltosyl-transferring)
LSSLYGIYSGYELGENTPREPGSEEYLNSEKYEYKARDWDAPGNLVDYVTRINRIRRENRALHGYTNLRFYAADDPDILFYGKTTPDQDNVILVAVNLDPFAMHAGMVDVPIAELGIGAAQSYRVHELVSDQWYDWRGARNYVELDPTVEPAQVFVLHR